MRCATRFCARLGCAARRRLCCCVGVRIARALALCAAFVTTLVIAHLNLSARGALRRRDAPGAAASPEHFVAPYAVDVVTRRYSELHSVAPAATLWLPLSTASVMGRVAAVLLLATLGSIAALVVALLARCGRPTCVAACAAPAVVDDEEAEAKKGDGSVVTDESVESVGADGAVPARPKGEGAKESGEEGGEKKAEADGGAAASKGADADATSATKKQKSDAAKEAKEAAADEADVQVPMAAATLALVYLPALFTWVGSAAMALNVLSQGAVSLGPSEATGSALLHVDAPTASVVWNLWWSLGLAFPVLAHLASVWWHGRVIVLWSTVSGAAARGDRGGGSDESSDPSGDAIRAMDANTFDEVAAKETYDAALADELVAMQAWADAMETWSAVETVKREAAERRRRVARARHAVRDRVGESSSVEVEFLSPQRTLRDRTAVRALDTEYDQVAPELLLAASVAPRVGAETGSATGSETGSETEGTIAEAVQLDTLLWSDEAPATARDAPRVATLCVRESKLGPPIQPSSVGSFANFRKRLHYRWALANSGAGSAYGGAGGSGLDAQRAAAAANALRIALIVVGAFAAGCCGTTAGYRLRYASAALALVGVFGGI